MKRPLAFVFALAACGPNYRYAYEGEGAFERCYALDYDNAAAPDGKLTPGLHSLRVIVTDRPWYRPFEYGPDGMVVLDADGEPVRVDATAATVGVPDLPGGATYSVADYVFRCRDGLDPDAGCNCAEEM